MNKEFTFARIGYVYIPTSNIDESIEWYTRNLSFKLMDKFIDRGSFLAVLHHPYKNSIALLLIETEDDKRMEILRNGKPFPIMAINCPDIEYTYNYLKGNGVVVEDIQILGDGEAKYFYFRDNQNNFLEAAWSIWDPKDEIKEDFPSEANEYIFESPRLGFRMWNESDRALFAKMNDSKEVMRYFPKTLDSKETDDFLNRVQEHFKENGYGLWAVELKDTKDFIGFIGLLTATFEADFTPCVEIGWRLDNKYWNKGYATEGAKACLEYGFNKLNLDTIYSFTAQINKPSENVMKKIGLKKVGEFKHPRVEDSSLLKPHVLYKIDKDEYEGI